MAGALFRVWHGYFNLPLSGRLKDFASAGGRKYEAAAVVFGSWLAGIFISVIALLVTLIFNRFGGALVFTLLAYGLLLNHDRGSGDGMVARMISEKLPGEYIPFDQIMPILVVILKLFLLAVLFFYGSPWFLGCVFAGGAAMEVYLAGMMEVTPPLIDNSEASCKRFRLTVAGIFIISFLISAPAASCGALTIVLLWKYAGKLTEQRGITFHGIRGYGAICVWLMLLAGVLTI